MTAIQALKKEMEQLSPKERLLQENQLLADAARLTAFQHPVARTGGITLCRVAPGIQEESLKLDADIVRAKNGKELEKLLASGRKHMLLVESGAGLGIDEIKSAVAGHPTLRTVFIAQA